MDLVLGEALAVRLDPSDPHNSVRVITADQSAILHLIANNTNLCSYRTFSAQNLTMRCGARVRGVNLSGD